MYRRVKFRGVVTDARTAQRLTAAEKILGRRLRMAQGSFSTAVAGSGLTHAGPGVVDVSTKWQGLTRAQKIEIVAALRTVGFAAWLREETPGVWSEHIHAVAIGSQVSPAAAAQVEAYRSGFDGLAGLGGRRPDPQAFLNIAPRTFAQYLRSIKPKRGRATVTAPRGTWSRRTAERTGRQVIHRKAGQSFTYTGVRYVAGETWLRTTAGNWILSKRTSRGV